MDFILLRPELLNRQILDILDVLTPTKKLPITEAREIVRQQILKNHYTWVGYDNGIPVCMASLVLIKKLGQNGSLSGLIEDVVVSKNYQGKGYGEKIVSFVCEKAENYGVYKIILNCKVELERFYMKNGFFCKGLYMRKEYNGFIKK